MLCRFFFCCAGKTTTATVNNQLNHPFAVRIYLVRQLVRRSFIHSFIHGRGNEFFWKNFNFITKQMQLLLVGTVVALGHSPQQASAEKHTDGQTVNLFLNGCIIVIINRKVVALVLHQLLHNDLKRRGTVVIGEIISNVFVREKLYLRYI